MTTESVNFRSPTAFDRFCITMFTVLTAAKFVVLFVGSPAIEIVRFACIFAGLGLCGWRIVEAGRTNVVTPFLVFYGGRVEKAKEPMQFLLYYWSYWAAVIGILALTALSVLKPGSVQWS